MPLAIAGGILIFRWSEGKMKSVNQDVVRVAFPRQESPLQYEPANIQFAYEYIFLETIYSPLVEYDEHGEIQPAVASKFWWDNNELHLAIREDLKTADGYQIGTDDVVFSLKRVMLLGGNTHGNLTGLLCSGQPLNSIDQVCPGIRVQGQTVILSPQHPTPFLTAMLTGIDFAIVPRRSTDPSTLKIIDMRNTTGPMYLETVSPAGEVHLKANHTHFNFKSDQPKEIVLIPAADPRTKESRAIEMFDSGKLDLVTTIDSAAPEDILQYHLSHSDATTFHASMDIRIFLMRFSNVARDAFTLEERFAIGHKVVKALREAFNNRKSIKPTDQIVPAFGEGGLDSAVVSALRERVTDISIDRSKAMRIYLIRLPDVEIFKRSLTEIFPNATFVDSNQQKLPNWGDDDSDLILSGPDMGFVEDISLYSYALKGGIFRAPEGADKWLSDYMKNMNKEERIDMIRKLHLYNLEQGFAFPIFASPYVAMARSPWQITLPKMFANHPLWRIKFPR